MQKGRNQTASDSVYMGRRRAINPRAYQSVTIMDWGRTKVRHEPCVYSPAFVKERRMDAAAKLFAYVLMLGLFAGTSGLLWNGKQSRAIAVIYGLLCIGGAAALIRLFLVL